MRLDEYLRVRGLRRSHFAARIGTTATTITALCAGRQWLSRELALRIRDATDGAVTPNDFLPPFEPRDDGKGIAVAPVELCPPLGDIEAAE